MNTIIQKIFKKFAVVALVFAAVFGVNTQNVLAQTWVNDVQVLKVAKNGEFSNTNSTVEYVNAGDVVYVQIYYRAGTSMNDAYARLSGGGGASTSQTISGGVYSSQGSSTGQVQITSSQPFSLNPISARLFKNDGYGNRSEVDLSGYVNQVVGSGYQLGSLSQNLNTQGALVVKYQVVAQYQNNNNNNSNNYNYQCNDGYDNDGDGLRDQNDPDCHTDRNASNYYSYVPTYTENNYNNYNNNYVSPAVINTPTVITNPATNITETTARLNSNVSANGSDSTTWYEWGKTVNMENRTNSQSIGVGNNVWVADNLTNLDLGTVYFYRAVVRNNQGVTRYGGVESFKTLGTPVVSQPPVRTVVRTVTRVVNTNQTVNQPNLVANNLVPGLVALRVTDTTQVNGNQNACVGEEFNYEIIYQNVSGKTLTNAVLEVRIPTELDYVKSTNGGTYSNNDRSLVYNLGTLTPNQGGKLYVTTRATSAARGKDSVVTSLSLSYTNPTTLAQEEAIAYVIHNFGECSINNTALALFGDSFLPNTLAGWLLLILLILALILLARTVYDRAWKKTVKQTPSYNDPNNYNYPPNLPM